MWKKGGVQKRINASPPYKKVISLCGFRETFRGAGGEGVVFVFIFIIYLLSPSYKRREQMKVALITSQDGSYMAEMLLV